MSKCRNDGRNYFHLSLRCCILCRRRPSDWGKIYSWWPSDPLRTFEKKKWQHNVFSCKEKLQCLDIWEFIQACDTREPWCIPKLLVRFLMYFVFKNRYWITITLLLFWKMFFFFNSKRTRGYSKHRLRGLFWMLSLLFYVEILFYSIVVWWWDSFMITWSI